MVLVFSLLGGVASAAPTVSELEGVVSEWVKLKREAVHEAAQWQEERAGYERELSLLSTQREVLQRRLAGIKGQLDAQGDDKTRAERITLLSKNLKRVEAEVDASASRLDALRVRVPKPLADTLPQPVGAEGAVSGKLQRLLALHAALADLHNRVHITHEMLQISSDQERMCDVVYLGMARGFAVSVDNSFALVGEPGESGWVWKAKPALIESIRALHLVQSGEQPPAYIPVEVAP